MKETLISEYGDRMNDLMSAIRLFDKQQFNVIPFEGSWTPSQVSEHVYKSLVGIPSILEGDSVAVDRDPEQNRQNLKEVFLNYNLKMTSPDFIVPGDEPIDQVKMLAKLEGIKSKIVSAFEAADLTRICTSFQVPGSGPFTGMEWGWFIVYHTQRHTHQLATIHSGINN